MTGRNSNSEGFTLIEALIVVAIAIILTSMAVIAFQGINMAGDDANAYTLVMGQLQYARITAINQKVSVEVLLQAPTGSSSTVAVWQQASVCGGSRATTQSGSSNCVGGSGAYTQLSSVSLPTAPSLSQFAAGSSGFPTVGPDSLPNGGGWMAFTFPYGVSSNTCAVLRFEPDGSVQQVTSGGCGVGSTNTAQPLAQGVIYMIRSGASGQILGSAKAITIMGATGRVKGYRFIVAGSAGSGSWTQF